MSLHSMIAEVTEGDFKAVLEVKKPKSWLKSVSAFANGIGGSLFFGVKNDRTIIGLDDAQSDAESISRLIKERITPLPDFVLSAQAEEDKHILILEVHSGTATPYYYKADGVMEAYNNIGVFLGMTDRIEEAIPWFEGAADAGLADRCSQL